MGNDLIPEDEGARLAAVRRYDILDTPPDGRFDRITALAARIVRTPIAIVSIVDEDRIWFKSHHGVDGVSEIGRDPGLCASAILQDEPWLVNDAPADPRTLANPLVSGEFGLRFYAGAPLITADGYRLGTLCVIDREPRELTKDETKVLEELAAIVVDELDFRLAARGQVERERRRLEEELESARRLEGMARLAGGVAHDFNNHLGVILGYACLAAEMTPEGSDLGPHIDEIRRAAERASDLTAQLLAFGRREQATAAAVRINDVIMASEALLLSTLGENVELRLELDPDLRAIRLDSGQLERILVNLVLNARDALPRGGSVHVVTENAHAGGDAAGSSGADCVRLRVSDSGTGMAPEIAARAFDPFYTTKPEGSGTGLGLATVHGLVTQAGGTIALDSRENEGTAVTIIFPAAEPTLPASHRAGPPPAAEVQRTGGAILVVEDDRALLSLIERLLERSGYQVEAAATPAQALAVCADRERCVDLMLADAVMPSMSGSELAEAAAQLRPSLKVIFMSGYGDGVKLPPGLRESILLRKPFAPDELLRSLAARLDPVVGGAASSASPERHGRRRC